MDGFRPQALLPYQAAESPPAAAGRGVLKCFVPEHRILRCAGPNSGAVVRACVGPVQASVDRVLTVPAQRGPVGEGAARYKKRGLSQRHNR